MTKKERLRAIMGNLKNFDFDINPVYKIDEQDAFVLREMYGEYLRLKMQEQRLKEQRHKYYMKKQDENIARARERYKQNREQILADSKERYSQKKKEQMTNDC